MNRQIALGICIASVSLATLARAQNATNPANPSSHEGHGGHHEHHHHAPPPPAARPMSDRSLYQLELQFTDQRGQRVSWASFRGSPVLIAMFYSSCTTVCPLLLSDAKRLLSQLTDAERAAVRVVFVTIDPENDTAARLTATMREHGLDAARWSMLRGNERATRTLAMALGVQYRRLPDGNYSHSALITLLDREGLISASLEGLGQPQEPLLRAVRQAARPPSTR